MSSNLNSMTNQQIVATYNQAAEALGRPLVKKFRDKQTAIKRTEAILSELTPAPEKAKTPVRRAGAINLPYRGQLHKIRPDTLNERVLFALRQGTTIEDLAQLVAQWDRDAGNPVTDPEQRARATVRMLHTYTGLGIVTDQDGTMTVIEG